jgi:hypothetical protein
MKRLLLLLLLHLALQGFSQDYKRTYNWYFGAKAGLTFSDFNFSVSTNGAMDSEQGSSTISDTNGTLLFYTNGETVWNKNHQIMQNGKGLLGDQSSTQSSVVVPIPGNDSLYYIFTAEGGYIFGLQASLVNINAQGGLGEVTLKNIPLSSSNL